MSKKATHRTSASHLLATPAGYVFRQSIPPALRPILQRKEIGYSLRTCQLGEAKRRARRMLSFLDGFFFDCKFMLENLASHTAIEVDLFIACLGDQLAG